MQTIFSRQACLTMALLTAAAAPGGAQAPVADTGPQAVYSQTIRGVTVQLTRVAWDAVEPGDAAFAYYKTFHISYTVHADTPLTLPPRKKLTDYVTSVTAITSDGYPLDSSGRGPASASGDDVDPRWTLVAIDVDFLDPAAPPKATGRSVGPVTISDIPVPTQPDVETPTQAETRTPLGTRVLVEKVKISPDAKGIKTTFALRIIPDPDAPDLRFGCSTGTIVKDDTGVSFPRGGSSGGPTTGPGAFTIGVYGVPGPGAKTMSLTLDASEDSERLKQDESYRHFHMIVPLRLLNPDARRPYRALATVQGKDVVATLDSVGWQSGRYRTRIVLKDRTDPDITWRLREVRGKDDAGNALSGSHGTGEFLWKTDGSPLAPGESSAEMFVGTPGNPNGPWGVKDAPPGAKTLSLEADVYAFREDYHVLDFPKIPIPAGGQTLTLNRRVQAAPGIYLVLRKIFAYSTEHPLPVGFEDDNPAFRASAPSGLAVVMAEPPDPKGKTRFDFTVVAANDPTGRHLLPVRSQAYARGDALLGGSPPPPNDPARVATFFFRAPAPGAQTFNLRMDRDEKVRLPDRRETLTFPDIPAPATTGH